MPSSAARHATPSRVSATLTLVTCVLASSLGFIDSSVVNVGLPAIGHALGADQAALQWLVGGYLLPLSALLLLGGSLGDRYGRRLMLVLGVILFGLASAACGFAPNVPLLIGARVIQGIGAALLMPNSLALLSLTFEGQARGRAIGIWAAAGAATGAAGPVLGGWLIDLFSWRMIFFINLPLAALGIFLALRYVQPDSRREAQADLDTLGALLASAGLGALTWALISGTGPAGWDLAAIAWLCTGLLLLVGFIAWQRHQGEAAMMPLALFGSASFAGLTLLTFLLYGALGCLTVLLPYVLIEGSHYSSTQAGAALLPMPLTLAIASPLLGSLAGRIGPRSLLIIGPLIMAGGFALLLRLGAAADYWRAVLPALLVMALGLACAVAPLTTAVLAAVDARHTGSASGLNNAIARTGSLVAIALLGHVLASRGEALLGAFHTAALCCAAACVVSALCALPARNSP